MARSKVIVRDRGASKVMKTMREADGKIRVGVLGDAASEEKTGITGETVGDIATIHEFGLGVPERSFIRGYVDEKEAEIRGEQENIARGLAKGKIDIGIALDQLGTFLVAGIQERIDEGIDPALADVTVQRKGSSKQLVDTGQLKSSITYEVE